MISVIIPIYNSENTLRRCIDSVLAQTERDLEVLLIDDGATDGSGMIADGYRTDPRVTVYHKENGGLSSARNYGLDRAHGDHIAFADADDWIEPNAFETALRSSADICVFGYTRDYPNKTLLRKPVDVPETVSGEEAVRRLIVDASIKHGVWSKLYRRELFKGIRFPEGVIYEDIRTTYKILSRANRVALIPDVLYHYVQYELSLAHDLSARTRMDRWTATHELYQVFKDRDEILHAACVRNCAYSLFWAWAGLWKTDAEMRRRESGRIGEIVRFAKRYRRDVVSRKDCGVHVKAGMILASFGGRGSQLCAYLIRSAIQMLKHERLYSRSDCAVNGCDRDKAGAPAENGIKKTRGTAS